MTNSLTFNAGKLTPDQHACLRAMSEGKPRDEIADMFAISETYLSTILNRTLYPKLRVSKATEAVAIYSRYLAYREAADLITQAYSGDVHVDQVLTELAGLLRDRAKDLLP